jgi:hypothetical protein
MRDRRQLKSVIFCLAIPVTPSAAREVMTLAERRAGQFSVVEIVCESQGDRQLCTIVGTRISKPKRKPLGAIHEPIMACYVEVGSSTVSVGASGHVYVAQEGPAGSMCQTQLVTTIDFLEKRYVLRKFSDDHSGEVCSVQSDETHIYTEGDFAKAADDLSCQVIEAIPSMWQP